MIARASGWKPSTKTIRLLQFPAWSMRSLILAVLAINAMAHGSTAGMPSETYERMAEWTIVSSRTYADPFNDVDVDVVFERGGKTWRVPTFWRGGSEWTVRFAPPEPGDYAYHLESTDKANPDLNGHPGVVAITAYAGTNPLLAHGMLRVAPNHRYFEFADGTPFYWLGDTWWDGLSSRLSWDGFKCLTADRKAKGFTVVQLCGGLIPCDEEVAPVDPGFRNEGGPVWEAGFTRINPRYFDYADRRIQYLLDHGLTPAIVGGWAQIIKQMGLAKLKKHWRYLIARFGAYPVFWVLGGEVYDPPGDEDGKVRVASIDGQPTELEVFPGWTDVARYLRYTDPYHHPVAVHDTPGLQPLQDPTLTDFNLFQCGHDGWSAIPVELGQLQAPYGQPAGTKPSVIGEIGYERLGEKNLDDFQRVAFWEGMLNGAAGFTYGANGVWESYTAKLPFQRLKWSFYTWEEGMNFRGSREIGLGAKLLRKYPWWRFEPHPEWVSPHGTILQQHGPDVQGDWDAQGGNFHLPYAAGIPGEVRIIYIPAFGLMNSFSSPPTILGLETGVPYHAYFWEPTLGIKVDLGTIERPFIGPVVYRDNLDQSHTFRWTVVKTRSGQEVSLLNEPTAKNVVVAMAVRSDADSALVFRFRDTEDYVAVKYSPDHKMLCIVDRKDGADGPPLGLTSTPAFTGMIHFTAEVRDGWAMASIADASTTVSTPIVDIRDSIGGSIGVMHPIGGSLQNFGRIEVWRSPDYTSDSSTDKNLVDADGHFRGELYGPPGVDLGPGFGVVGGWRDFGRHKIVLLDAWRPKRLPFGRDWVLVMEKCQ